MMLTHTSTSPVRVHLPGFTSFTLAPAATKIITQAECDLRLPLLDDLGLTVDTEHVQQQGVFGYQDSVSVTKAGAAGATLTCTHLLPAGALVFGVTIKVLSTLTGRRVCLVATGPRRICGAPALRGCVRYGPGRPARSTAVDRIRLDPRRRSDRWRACPGPRIRTLLRCRWSITK